MPLDLSFLKQNFNKAKSDLQQIEENKINGIELNDFIFDRFSQYIDPIYFIENILRAHLPESRKHLHDNQIELIQAACNPKIKRVAAMFARQCFIKGTQLIDADNNLINVEDIRIGTKLKIPNNTFATVISTTSGQANLYKIENIENYDIPYYVTDNHKLVLSNNKKIIIQTVKDYLQNNSTLKGIKCITYTNNQYFSPEEIINIAYYLPNDINIYNKILNSSMNIKYIFIQELLKVCTWSMNQRYSYPIINMNSDIIFAIRRILWSMGYSTKIVNNMYMYIKYNLQYNFNISLYKQDTYYGFTLDSNDNLCILADNTITHNSGKCFAKDTLIRLYSGEIKKVQDITEQDILMGDDSTPRYIEQISHGQEQMVDIFTDINKISVNMSHDLVVYDNNEREYIISVQDYIQQNLHYKMKINSIEYPYEYSYINSYYAGYDHIFGYLLNTSIKTRKYVLAGLLDSLSINFIEAGINFTINNKLKNNVQELLQSLGYKIFTKYINNDNIQFNVLGSFIDIPCKNHSLNIEYNNPYIEFTIIPREIDNYYGFSLKNDNKKFLLSNGIIVHNSSYKCCV